MIIVSAPGRSTLRISGFVFAGLMGLLMALGIGGVWVGWQLQALWQQEEEGARVRAALHIDADPSFDSADTFDPSLGGE